MSFAGVRRSSFAPIALLLLGGLLRGHAIAQQKGAGLEPLL